MIIKQLLDEDFVNYKKPSMFIGFPSCTWKCDKECGMQVCQNSALATAKNIEISCRDIVERYNKNNITKAFVLGGLEPLDSWSDLFDLVMAIQMFVERPEIVIYTGYTKEEVMKEGYIERIRDIYDGILVIKFGRFIPNQEKHYDEVLGVYLASNNQFAERID